MFNIGGGEAVTILLVALVVLGPDKLPLLARRIGQVTQTLRQMATSFQTEMETAAKEIENATNQQTHVDTSSGQDDKEGRSEHGQSSGVT